MTADWRVWLHQRLVDDAAFTAIVPAAQVFGGGSIDYSPALRPFAVIRMEFTVPGPFRSVATARGTIWLHDDPGDYMRIDSALSAARLAILGADVQVGHVVDLADGVAAVWQGDSVDLANPDYGTILRTSSFDLYGRSGDA